MSGNESNSLYKAVCKVCQNPDKDIYSRGMCQACYAKNRRDRIAGRVEEGIAIPEEEIGDPLEEYEELEPEAPEEGEDIAEYRLTMAPMSQRDVDRLISDASSGNIALSVPTGDLSADVPKGLRDMHAYLQQFGYEFRRQIIKQMLTLGMSQLQIMAAFTNQEELRQRWIDPVRNPLDMFKRDFAAVEKELTKKKRSRGRDALQTYIERLEISYRQSNALANDGKATAQVRNGAMQMAHKIARDIAILERAIRTVPGQGDIPTTGTDPDDEESGGEYSSASDELEIPEIETD